MYGESKILAHDKHQQKTMISTYPRYTTATTAAHRSAKLLAAATTAPLFELDDGAVAPLVPLPLDEVVAAADEEEAEEEVRVAELMVVFRYMAVPVAALPLAPAPDPTAPVPTAPVPTAPVPTMAVAVAFALTTAVVVIFLLDEPEPPTMTLLEDDELEGVAAEEAVDETDDATDDEPEDDAD